MKSENMSFRCINCGHKADELYHDYRNGIIKLQHCVRCGKLVDKYVEFDPVFVCLDALLLKRQAFRHVFNNSGVQHAHWKLTLILLLCDAYTKLVKQTPERLKSHSMPDYVIYSTLEWGLYWNFFISAIELAIHLVTILIMLYIFSRVLPRIVDGSSSTMEKIRGLLLSNFGKILVVPAILWGSDYSDINLMLSKLFVFACNIQAIRVICPGWNHIFYLITVGMGHLVSMATTSFLQHSISVNR